MKTINKLPVVAALSLACVWADGARVDVVPDGKPGAAVYSDEVQGLVQTFLPLMLDFYEHASAVREILAGVTDQASADAAAPQIMEHLAALKEVGSRAKRLEVGELSREVKAQLGEALDAEMAARGISEDDMLELEFDMYRFSVKFRSASPAFFGSEAFETAFRKCMKSVFLVDVDDVPSRWGMSDEEVEQKVRAAGEETKSLILQGLEVLRGITDKASADAAAPQFRLIEQRLGGIRDELCNEGLDGEFNECCLQNAELMGLHEEVSATLSDLRETDPPFYGSTELRDAIDGPVYDDEDDEEEEE